MYTQFIAVSSNWSLVGMVSRRYITRALATCAVLAGSFWQTQSVHAALVGYWPLEDNAANNTVQDASGHGYNGALKDTSLNSRNTSATHISGGVVGSAFDFGTSNTQIIDISNVGVTTGTGGAISSLGSYTATVWFRNYPANGTNQHYWVWSDGTSSSRYQLEIFNNNTSYYNQQRGGGFSGPSSASIPSANWQLLTFTVQDASAAAGDSTMGQYVINSTGVLTPATATGKHSPLDNQSSYTKFTLGGGLIGSNTFARGQIDDAAIWSRVLTNGEMLAVYSLATNGTLNYGANNADKLFDVYEQVLSSFSVGGRTWTRTSGLSQTIGAVVQNGSNFTVQLDASGFGITTASIPEPNSITLFVIGMVGLFSWKRRRSGPNC